MTAPKITPARKAELRDMGPSNKWWALDSGDHLNIMEELLDALEAAEAERNKYKAALEKLGILSEDCNCSCCKYDAKAARDALAKHRGGER